MSRMQRGGIRFFAVAIAVRHTLLNILVEKRRR
jgi:hypothetical protein